MEAPGSSSAHHLIFSLFFSIRTSKLKSPRIRSPLPPLKLPSCHSCPLISPSIPDHSPLSSFRPSFTLSSSHPLSLPDLPAVGSSGRASGPHSLPPHCRPSPLSHSLSLSHSQPRTPAILLAVEEGEGGVARSAAAAAAAAHTGEGPGGEGEGEGEGGGLAVGPDGGRGRGGLRGERGGSLVGSDLTSFKVSRCQDEGWSEGRQRWRTGSPCLLRESKRTSASSASVKWNLTTAGGGRGRKREKGKAS